MKKPSYPMANIGSVPLLMTFIILCLAVFATLALSGAVREYRYSQKIAEYNQAYYEASNSATETLKEIDNLLHTAYLEFSDEYFKAAREQLSQLPGLQMDFTKTEPVLTYEVPINDSQKLQVVLTLNSAKDLAGGYGAAGSRQAHGQTETPEPAGYYRIMAWQKLPSAPWKADNRMNLLHPDN